MSRQVRLDDDVATLVEQYQQSEGLKSLSLSANTMLRLAAGPEETLEVEPVPELPDPEPLPEVVELVRVAERPLEVLGDVHPAFGGGAPVVLDAPRAEVVIQPRSPRTRRRQLPGPSPDGRTLLPPPTPQGRPTVAPAAPPSWCPHPILRRRGDKCGVCGVTVEE